MPGTREIHDLRDPRHPANRRLFWSGVASMCLGLTLCVLALSQILPFVPTWLIAILCFGVTGTLRERYRMRVRPYTPFELFRSICLVFVAAVVIGIAGPPVLVWFLQTFMSAP